MPPQSDHPEDQQGKPTERPLRWRDLWKVFLPLVPWIAIVLVLSMLSSLLGYGRWPWYILGMVILLSQILANVLRRRA
jgi:hypothetical protein